MENIVKHITLECAKNRFYNNYMPALDSETLEPIVNVDCWGDFPYDVIIESGDMFGIFNLAGNLPLLPENDYYIFRFGNMAKIYGWLNKFAIETKFYKIATRKGKPKWINIEQEFYSGDTLDVFATLPSTDEYLYGGDICDVIAVHKDADRFNRYFRISGDTTRYEVNFKSFVDNIFSGNSNYRFKSPYLDLPLSITEDVRSVGDFLSDEQIWKANKKYYVGDVVLHDDNYYVLDKGDAVTKTEVTGELYRIVSDDFSTRDIYNFIDHIPDDLTTLSKDKLNILYSEDNTVMNFWIVQAYYKGYYNEDTRITEFDDGSNHWIKIVPTSYGEEEENIFVSSKLDEFRSIRKSYDINSNELPFNVIVDNGENLVALVYLLGYTNYAIKNNGAVVDYFEKVEFLKELSDDNPYVIQYSDVDKNRNILISGVSDDCSYVRLTYYSGCEVIDDGVYQTVNTNTGVKYTETRKMWFKTAFVPYDSSSETEFTYIELSLVSEESKGVDTKKACAKIVYKAGTVDSIPLHVFSDSKLFGSTFVGHKQDSIDISRGRYGAFERHNILGEVNSMDDLENYRNNYFKL